MDTLKAVANLGLLYRHELKGFDDLEKALEYNKRALKGYEKRLGMTHP